MKCDPDNYSILEDRPFLDYETEALNLAIERLEGKTECGENCTPCQLTKEAIEYEIILRN